MTTLAPYDEKRERKRSRAWQIAVFALVVLGSLATAGYAWIETFWG